MQTASGWSQYAPLHAPKYCAWALAKRGSQQQQLAESATLLAQSASGLEELVHQLRAIEQGTRKSAAIGQAQQARTETGAAPEPPTSTVKRQRHDHLTF